MSSDRSSWQRSRDNKAPYASQRVSLHLSESFMTAAKQLLFDIPGHPYKSVNELLRDAMATGLGEMVDHGVPVNKLRNLIHLAEGAEQALQARDAADRLVEDCTTLIRGAETAYQRAEAEKFVRETMVGVPDPEIVGRLEKLL